MGSDRMMFRRGFIQAAAASTLSSTLAHGLLANHPAAIVKGDWIDAHVHVWTPDTDKYPLSKKFKKADMVPASFTPNELLAQCLPQGVTRVVLIQMSFYEFDNRYMLDCMEKHRSVFSGVAIVDESRGDVTDTMKGLSKQGVRGFRLYADREKASAWSGSHGMKAMWGQAADSGLAMCLLANPDALPAILQMCERYPKTRVVIDHFARIGIGGSVDSKQLDDLCRLSKFENVFVKTSAFYALGRKSAPYLDLGPMIERLVKEFGVQRLMWATDCPYQVEKGHTYADSISLIRDRLEFLTDSDKQWILRGTADKVFFS
jgi:predicted TIM-barrel fold metal-dependent hydrolase